MFDKGCLSFGWMLVFLIGGETALNFVPVPDELSKFMGWLKLGYGLTMFGWWLVSLMAC
jgi:hypothetical protein